MLYTSRKFLFDVSKIKLLTCYIRTIYVLKNQCTNDFIKELSAKNILINNNFNLYISKRLMTKKKATVKKIRDKIQEDEEEDDDDDDDDVNEELEKGGKLMSQKLGSLRIDVITKSGFGIPRNKVEEAFYGSKIRINGQKVLKKSTEVCEGDEIDLIKGVNPANPNTLIIMRITILSWKLINDSYLVKMIRNKNMIIEQFVDKVNVK